MRFLDIYQVTQALNTVLTNQKQLSDMRRSWQKVDFESVRNQSALVCNCRHEDLVQLLEVEFVSLMDSLPKSSEPVREVMSWADKCCERLMGSSRATHGGEERSTMSSRSVLIRWGYVTSQVMRDLVSSCSLDIQTRSASLHLRHAADVQELEARRHRRVERGLLLGRALARLQDDGHAEELLAHVPRRAFDADERRRAEEALLGAVGFLGDGGVQADDGGERHGAVEVLGDDVAHDAPDLVLALFGRVVFARTLAPGLGRG